MPGSSVAEAAHEKMAVAYKLGGVPTETAVFYDQWAQNDEYEQHLNRDLYRGPAFAAKAVADFYPDNKRSNVKILDVAAGTGFVAECLKGHGFSNVDALDPSEGMMKKARVKGLYKHYMIAFVDDKPLPTLEDTYDCAVCSGGMGEGHIPYFGMDQLIRVVKPGGLICIAMREEYASKGQYSGKLEPHMEKLEKEGKWQRIARTQVQGYCDTKTGLIFQFKVL